MSDESEEKVMVYMAVSERTEYAKEFELPKSKFEKYKSDLEAGGMRGVKATLELGGYIDVINDWVDAETESIEDFEIMKEPEQL